MKKSRHHTPPLWADRLLEWYCAPDLLEDLQGDLHERFYNRLRSRGVVSARLNFILDTLSFVRPYVLRRKQLPYNLSYVMMLKHYFKTGLRNARRDKQYLVVNTLGLALGIGCSLILVAYIFSELSFDQSNRYADRTYRISLTTLIDTQETQFAPIPPAIGLAIKAIVPEIEKMARMMTWSGDGGPATIAYADKLFNEAGIMNADSTVFDVMDYHLVIGDRSALQRPNSIVLSETLAKKIFGSDYQENNRLLNTVIKVDQKELAVTGVFQDISYTTHVRPQALIAWQGYGNDGVWDDSHAYTYVRLTTRENSESVQSKINKFIDTDENIRRVSEAFGAKVKVFIDPLASIHMHSNKAGEFQSPGNVNYLYALGVIAVFFLLMSSINYINLSIAASAHRFKEIGVRKVMGALRNQVQRQFVTEASVLILIASILGFLVFYLLIPPFNTIMDYRLDALLLLNGTFLIIAISMLALLALMSGYYPAFYLSLANPIAVFKNKFQVGNTKLHFRKSLLIAQFAISSLMIVAVLAVTSQMNYLSKQTLGINKENILVISMPWPAIETLPTLKTELERVSGVTKVAATDYVPGFSTMIDEHKVERPNGEMQSSTVGRLFIDKDYMTLLGLKIIEGRNFDPTSMVDYKESFLVNEAAVRAYGWRETQQGPLGRKINGFNYGKQGKIIGVVKDVHLYSLQAKIQPLIISMGIYMQYVYVKIGADDIKQTIKDIEKVYSKVVQNYPLEYQFLDERFDRLYDADKKMNKAMVGGGVILIFISCIGLFALSAFVVNQRTKEIGIRKVLGATMREIMTMLCREYVYLILIANLIAVVGSYFLVQKWLSGYAYRVEFSWWLLFVPVVITLTLAIVSVSFQVVKAAIANPVKSLMYE